MSDAVPPFVWVDGGSCPADGTAPLGVRPGVPAGRRHLRDAPGAGGHVTELAEHVARLRRSADGLAIELPDDVRRSWRPGSRSCWRPRGWTARTPTRRSGSRSPAAPGPRAGSCRRRRGSSWRRSYPGVAGAARRRGTSSTASRWWPRRSAGTRQPDRDAQDHVARGLRLRAASRRAAPAPRTRCSSRERLPVEATTANIFLVRGAPDGVTELATPSLECAILPGTTRSWLLRWAASVGLRPVEGWLTPDELAAAHEAFCRSSVAGILPVTRFNGHPIGAGVPGPWTRRARADREAFIRGGVRAGAGVAPARGRAAHRLRVPGSHQERCYPARRRGPGGEAAGRGSEAPSTTTRSRAG